MSGLQASSEAEQPAEPSEELRQEGEGTGKSAEDVKKLLQARAEAAKKKKAAKSQSSAAAIAAAEAKSRGSGKPKKKDKSHYNQQP